MWFTNWGRRESRRSILLFLGYCWRRCASETMGTKNRTYSALIRLVRAHDVFFLQYLYESSSGYQMTFATRPTCDAPVDPESRDRPFCGALKPRANCGVKRSNGFHLCRFALRKRAAEALCFKRLCAICNGRPPLHVVRLCAMVSAFPTKALTKTVCTQHAKLEKKRQKKPQPKINMSALPCNRSHKVLSDDWARFPSVAKAVCSNAFDGMHPR